METLNLPNGQIPGPPAKRVPPEAARRWIIRSLQLMCSPELLKRIREDPSRRPVNARFRLLPWAAGFGQNRPL